MLKLFDDVINNPGESSIKSPEAAVMHLRLTLEKLHNEVGDLSKYVSHISNGEDFISITLIKNMGYRERR